MVTEPDDLKDEPVHVSVELYMRGYQPTVSIRIWEASIGEELPCTPTWEWQPRRTNCRRKS